MALVLRIDVDRPYGKQGLLRHIASRVSSDYYLPRLECMGYLDELKTVLRMLNESRRQAFVFFRRCTLPSPGVVELMESGGHHFGLHLEDSRSFKTFRKELDLFEKQIERPVSAFSKHGSGKLRLGRHHFPPYEFDRYVEWGCEARMRLLLGNLEDPRQKAQAYGSLVGFPSAFWLEHTWRDTARFPVDWLVAEAKRRDVVMLFHPDNVIADPVLMAEFRAVVEALETTTKPAVA